MDITTNISSEQTMVQISALFQIIPNVLFYFLIIHFEHNCKDKEKNCITLVYFSNSIQQTITMYL